MHCILAANKPWCENMAEDVSRLTGVTCFTITEPCELFLEKVKKICPRYLFFPHWSHLIPSEIYENYECVVFHMTDLPFGRGGSPLQNLISRGIYETQITAFKCVAGIDAGPVYFKKPLSLHGSAEEIYLRAAEVTKKMIVGIIKDNPNPKEQKGNPVFFKRRTPEQSKLPEDVDLKKVFDHIRMLDAEGYPKAFIKIGGLKIEFSRAKMKDSYIVADVRILIEERGK